MIYISFDWIRTTEQNEELNRLSFPTLNNITTYNITTLLTTNALPTNPRRWYPRVLLSTILRFSRSVT